MQSSSVELKVEETSDQLIADLGSSLDRTDDLVGVSSCLDNSQSGQSHAIIVSDLLRHCVAVTDS